METLQYCALYDFNNCSSNNIERRRSFDQLHSTGTTNSSTTASYEELNTYYPKMEHPDPSLLDQLDPNLEPQSRVRCNTWPLRPVINPPSVQDQDSAHGEPIKEEPEPCDGFDAGSQHNLSGDGTNSLGLTPSGLAPSNNGELGSQGDLSGVKKQSSRKNAWGNLSYADLITKAIGNSPDKRLTLSQIYDWMVQNVSYFRDKGDSNSSAGWKNSIRHNLSLHNRFMRIQNEGAGKSSWWVINPDAKPGKAPRRRGNSMDSKQGMKEKRNRMLKRLEQKKQGGLLKDSPVSPAMAAHSPDGFTLSPGDGYRERSCSNASSIGNSIGGRRSPLGYDNDLIPDSKLSPWGSEGNLDYIPDYPMDTKLTEELDVLKLQSELPSSYLNELEEMNPSPCYADVPSAPQHLYVPNKPYQSYTTDQNGYNPPPPPYPNVDPQQQQQQQQQYSMMNQVFPKDPMIASYNSNASNNNTTSNQIPTGQAYSTYNSTNMAPGRGLNSPSGRPSPRATPSSIRAALGGPPLPQRLDRMGPSSAIKASSPLLVNQLLKYQPTSQGIPPQGVPYTQPQQQMINTNQPAVQSTGYNNQQFNSQLAQQQGNELIGYDLPNDIDISLDMLPVNELQCDVDQVLQREISMDGGQLDFTGFGNYSQQQQQANQSQQQGKSNHGDLGVLS